MKTIEFGVIGGGSIFSPELVDLIAQDMESFGSVHIRFMDVDAERMSVVGGLCERIVAKRGVAVKISYVGTYEEAVAGSDYVLIQFRVGGEDARIRDELLGKKYKIPFVETVSVCGIATFLRTYYEAEKIASAIQATAPDAWVLNFSNPAELTAEALHRRGVKKVVGVCNAATSLLGYIREQLCLGSADEIYMNWRGLNHLTMVDQLYVNGKECLKTLLDRVEDYASARVPFPKALLDRLGYLPNQYFQYYLLKERMVEKLQSAEKVRSQVVKEVNRELLESYRRIDYVPDGLKNRGGYGYSKAVVDTILALHTGKATIAYLVVENHGALSELPAKTYVEVPCLVEKNRIQPLAQPELAPEAGSLIHTMKAFELELLEAAEERDVRKLYCSMLMHPLIASHCLAEPLLEDILSENRAWLPDDFDRAQA